MTTKLSDDERNVWKIAYTIHEKYHDREMLFDGDWVEFMEDIRKMQISEDEECVFLSSALGVALIEIFDSMYKRRQYIAAHEPKQTVMDFGIGGMIG